MIEGPDQAIAAAAWAGVELDGAQLTLLSHYASWLRREAVPAGGLGPGEAERLWGRHIADSLVFAVAWSQPPDEVLDVGSGVGLPGIPLAIAWPHCRVTLLDRGGRRVRLLRRAVRILALPNAIVAQGDALDVADEWEAVTFRGSLPAPEAVGLSSRLLHVGGRAVLGLSRKPEKPERAEDLVNLAVALGLKAEVQRVPEDALDGGAWLLIMRLGDTDT